MRIHFPVTIVLATLAAFPAIAGPEPDTDDLKAVEAEMSDYFQRSGPKPGSFAPDFELERVRGGTLRASDLWAKRPVVVVTGSYSCPQFRETTDGRAALFWEFSDRVDFVVIYTQEAHSADGSSPYSPVPFVPKENTAKGVAVPQPKTYGERLKLARECRRNLKLVSDVAVDTMDNATWKKFGSSPNFGCLIAPGGKVVLEQGLFNAERMRSALLKLLSERT
jgi:hypothetical protein